MKQALALLLAGLLALVVQSGIVRVVPHPLCPDLGLLVVVAIGLYWEPLPSGFALAAVLGYASDVLSGSLLGQHGLLRLLSFSASRLGGRQLNLRGVVPLAVFVAALTLAYALALHVLQAFFSGTSVSWMSSLGRATVHALVNGLAAPVVAAGIASLCSWTGDDEGGRRGFRLDRGTSP